MFRDAALWAGALVVVAGCDRGDDDRIAPAAASPGKAEEERSSNGREVSAGDEGNAELTEEDAMETTNPAVELHPRLRDYVGGVVEAGFDAIPENRRDALGVLADFVRDRRAAGEPAPLTFICTHNSRRSHMGQLWASTAAAWYGIDAVGTYSGGTEATAFNPRAVAALERAGFEIQAPDGAPENPRYRVTYAPDGPVLTAFSKVYDDPSNPQEGFAAVMTCAAADASCPVVPGAAVRVSIPYVDPKEADDTPEEPRRYDERARQIATEMFYLFSQV